MSGTVKAYLELVLRPEVRYEASVSGLTFNWTDVPAGDYKVRVHVNGIGFAKFTSDSEAISRVKLVVPDFSITSG